MPFLVSSGLYPRRTLVNLICYMILFFMVKVKYVKVILGIEVNFWKCFCITTASACAISTCAISACAIYLNTTLLLALITITGISLNYNWTLIQTCNLYTLVFFFLAFLDILQVFFEERLRYTVIVTFLAAIIQIYW
jgi:hypothetical protein